MAWTPLVYADLFVGQFFQTIISIPAISRVYLPFGHGGENATLPRPSISAPMFSTGIDTATKILTATATRSVTKTLTATATTSLTTTEISTATVSVFKTIVSVPPASATTVTQTTTSFLANATECTAAPIVPRPDSIPPLAGLLSHPVFHYLLKVALLTALVYFGCKLLTTAAARSHFTLAESFLDHKLRHVEVTEETKESLRIMTARSQELAEALRQAEEDNRRLASNAVMLEKALELSEKKLETSENKSRERSVKQIARLRAHEDEAKECETVIRAKDATIQELRDQLAASQAETDQVRSTSVPRSDAEKLQLEMDKLRGEITKLEVQLDTNEEELAALQTTVAAVNTENEKLLDLAKESLHREQLLDNKAATTLQLSGRSAAEARKEMDSLKKESARLQKLLHKHSVRNAGATKKSESERAASL